MNAQLDTIDSGKCIINEGLGIFILKFVSQNHIKTNEFCDEAQNILYDDLGSTGHFRIAPAYRPDLTPDFIEGVGLAGKNNSFLTRENNELIVAFIIRETDPDLPISQEFEIFPKEINQFCEIMDLNVEQMDIERLYS